MSPTAAIGILETTGYTPAMVALDTFEKHATLRVLQAELNDLLGVCIKVTGPIADLEDGLRRARAIAEQLRGDPVTHVLRRADPQTESLLDSPPEFNPLIQQDVVHQPLEQPADISESTTVNRTPPDALGFIETQGFTAVFAAIDAACKAANVEVLGKEKLGGGYVTVVFQGDVAAVRAAVEAGASQVESLGQLIAAHVVTGPTQSVLSLLPAQQ